MSEPGFDVRPVRRIGARSGAEWDPQQWPYTLTPVARLLRDGLELVPGVTFLGGKNGSGKSTLVEAITAAAGLDAEGGSPQRHALEQGHGIAPLRTASPRPFGWCPALVLLHPGRDDEA